jgi:soluble lytic murein transglycosylase-like protein
MLSNPKVPATRAGARVAALTLALVASAAGAHADIDTQVGSDGVLSISNRAKGGGGRSSAKSPKRRNTLPIAMPSDKSPERFSRYDDYIRQAAILYQIPDELVRAVIKVESDYDPRAVSPANARGLMQMIPETAERMMVTDVFDPRQNIFGGTRYLRVLANLFNGDLELTIAGYNAGEHAVIRHGGIPPYAETQFYVTKVLAYYRHYRALSASRARPG